MCGSVKALLAVQVVLFMLPGCMAGQPASTPRVGTTASSTPATTPAAQSASANSSADNANPVVDQALLKRGYQPRKIHGQLKYCRTQTLTGTHFSNTVCLTQEEIRATDGNTQSNLDTLGRAAHTLCPNNKCD